MRIVLTIIVIAGLGVGGYFLWKHLPRRDDGERLARRPTTALAEYRDIQFNVVVAGELAPAEQVSVRPEVNGRIAMLNVDIGDKAKLGAVLFTLDDKELQQQKSSSMVEIDRARLQLDQKRRDFGRARTLHQENLIPLETYEASRTELELGSNALQRAEKELALIDERLTKTVITAPFDCTVLVRPVSAGQAVAGSGGMSGGTEVLVIADLNKLVINSHVNQADVTRLKQGMEVDVAIEAVPGLTVHGLIERIAPQATTRNNIKGFATRIAIKEIDPRIQPGMTANITIPVASAEGVLAVPLGAVFSEQGERFVYVKKGEEEFEKRPVQLGLSDNFYAEVASGLNEGEIVSLEAPPGESFGGQEKGLAGANGKSGTKRVGKPKDGKAGEKGSPGALTGPGGLVRSNGVSGEPALRPGRTGS